MKKIISIQKKVNKTIFVVFSIIFIIFFSFQVLMLLRIESEWRKDLLTTLDAVFDRDRDAIAIEIVEDSIIKLENRLAQISKIKGIKNVEAFNHLGYLILSIPSKNEIIKLPLEEQKDMYAENHESDSLLYTRKLFYLGQDVGYIRYTASLDRIHAFLNSLIVGIVCLSILVLWITIFILYSALRKEVVIPLQRLIAFSKDWNPGRNISKDLQTGTIEL